MPVQLHPTTSTVAAGLDPRSPQTAPDWFTLMRHGDFAAAWKLSDASLQSRRSTPCSHWPRHLQYVWNGTPLNDRRVLVRCYHGLGDTIQFIRYAAPLKRIAREVIVWAQPALLDLLGTVEGIDRILPLHDGIPEVDYDVDVELMELPYVFRTTLDTLPRAVPYLHLSDVGAPPEVGRRSDVGGLSDVGGPAGAGSPRNPRPPHATPHPGKRCPPRALDRLSTLNPQRSTGSFPLKVGLVWRSGDWDERRSIPAPLFWPLATLPNLELFILQHGPALKEWGSVGGTIIGDQTVLEAAHLIRAMDLVITVDTLTAHLAGALATEVWTLLPAEADWRWMIHRDDSPWYPTMRLFRQPCSGDWNPIIAQVLTTLQSRTAESSR